MLAFLLGGQLSGHPGPVLVTSASSRTAQALAQQVGPAGPPVVGLTSPERVDACAATGLFAAVLGYDDLDALGARLPPARRCWSTWPGAPRCAGGSGRRPGAAAVLVGATHRAGPALHPEPGERVFSAVDRLRTATAELGAAELDRRQQRAWREYLDRCGRAVVPRLDRERAAVERTYREVRDGRCPPGHAHLVSIR